MRLLDLEPAFMLTIDHKTLRTVDSLAEAQGVQFLCPECFEKNGGSVGTHWLYVWFHDRGVDSSWEPTPRWNVSGTGLADLTLTPSILITSGCKWHGFVTDGEIR